MSEKLAVVILACEQAVPHPKWFEQMLAEAAISPRVVPEPCSSKVEVYQMLRILAHEADLLWVVGCPEAACRLVEGSPRMAKRVGYARDYLAEIGLEPERLGMSQVFADNPEMVTLLVRDMVAQARRLGRNPARHRA